MIMMTLLFLILFFVVFGKLAGFAIRTTWSMMKVFLFVIFLPTIIFMMVLGGLIKIALPILIVVGIFSMLERANT